MTHVRVSLFWGTRRGIPFSVLIESLFDPRMSETDRLIHYMEFYIRSFYSPIHFAFIALSVEKRHYTHVLTVIVVINKVYGIVARCTQHSLSICCCCFLCFSHICTVQQLDTLACTLAAITEWSNFREEKVYDTYIKFGCSLMSRDCSWCTGSIMFPCFRHCCKCSILFDTENFYRLCTQNRTL